MSQTFLTNSGRKGVDLEPIASVGHDAVLTRGRRSTKEGGALLTIFLMQLKVLLVKMNAKIKKNSLLLSFIFLSNFLVSYCYGSVVSVGDSFGGGTVFCVSQTEDITKCVPVGSGKNGLIMANKDQANYDSPNHGVTWSSKYSETGARSDDNGSSNTDIIIAALPRDNPGNNAAHLCRSYIDPIEGHTDWYLPSKNELNKMYLYAKANNLIGKGCSGGVVGGVQCLIGGDKDAYKWYWSSTEPSLYLAWSQPFGNGGQYRYDKVRGRRGVRAVRAFNNSSIQQFNNLLLKGSSKLEAVIFMAEDRNSNIEDLRFVFGHPDADARVLEVVAAHPNADDALRAEIFARQSSLATAALLAAAQDPAADPAALLAVAQNPATNLIGLTAVIHHPNINAHILEVVAAHPNADDALRAEISSLALLAAAQDPAADPTALLAVAQNPATNLIGLTAVIHHPNINAHILEVVVAHPNADDALRAEIFARQSSLATAALLAAAQDPAADPAALLAVAQNPATNLIGLTAVIHHPNVNAHILEVVATHPNAGAGLLADIIEHPNADAATLLAVARSPATNIIGLTAVTHHPIVNAHNYVVSVGDSFGGGTVFCVSQTEDITQCVPVGTGKYGLIMANEDQANYDSPEHGVTWSSVESKTDALSADNGASNTDIIIATNPRDNPRNNAAYLCRSYIDPIEGHTDWYLPSKNELNKMYIYASANSLIGRDCSGSVVGGVQCLIGGHNSTCKYYWSSTECSSGYAWAQGFSGGLLSGSYKGDYSFGARAVRAFNNNSPIQQFNNLLLKDSSRVKALIFMAEDRNSNIEDLRFAFNHPDLDAAGLSAIAASPNADADLLADIIWHRSADTATLLAVAQNHATNLIGLTSVIHHPNVNAHILEVVAAHPNADANTLLFVAQNPNTTIEGLRAIVVHPEVSNFNLTVVAAHPNIDTGLQAELILRLDGWGPCC